MPRATTQPQPDPIADDTYDDTGNDTRDAINPTAPEAMESKAQELVSRGIEASALVVKIYDTKNATPGTPGKYLGQVSYANFGEDFLAQTYGPGFYTTHLNALDNRARGTQRVTRFEIAADARPATTPAAIESRPMPAGAGSPDFMQAFLLQMMQANQTTQLEAMRQQTAMMQALAARPGPDMSSLWTAIIGVMPQVLEMLSKRSGGGSTIGQLRELADFMAERGSEKPEDQSTGKWVIETILPAFMQFMGKDAPAAASAEQPQRHGLPAAAKPAAPTLAEQPPTAANAAAPDNDPAAAAPATSDTEPNERPAEFSALVNFGDAIAPMLRAAALQDEPNVETYAEVIYDMAYAHGVARLFDPQQQEEGTLTAAIVAMHQDLGPMAQPVLMPIERHLRAFIIEDRQAEQDAKAGQLRIGNEIKSANEPANNRHAEAKPRSAKTSKKPATEPAQEGQKG
jgi:hypothetical protein